MNTKLNRSFKSSEHNNEKGDGSYRGFGYLRLFSDLINLAHRAKENYCNFAIMNGVVDTKTVLIQTGPNILKGWLENKYKPKIIF